MRQRLGITLACVTLALIGLALMLPQLAVTAQESEVIERGREIYRQHCASCQGVDAKGHGPAADALKKNPPDLTLIQKKGEKFPFDEVMNIIDGETVISAHGSREMPVWGTIFRKAKGEMLAHLDIYALTKYIESIQRHRP